MFVSNKQTTLVKLNINNDYINMAYVYCIKHVKITFNNDTLSW